MGPRGTRWVPEGPETPEDTVEVTIEAVAGASVVTAWHTPAEGLEGSGAEQGWHDVMDRVAAWG